MGKPFIFDHHDINPELYEAKFGRRGGFWKLLNVLERRLEGRQWLMGDDYSIADIATWPWVRNLYGFYGASELVGSDRFPNVKRAVDAFVARPAVARGLEIPKRAAA